MDAVNRRVEAYAAAAPQVLWYVDVNPLLFNADGTPRLEWYLADGLHFGPPAYDAFARILKPVLERAPMKSSRRLARAAWARCIARAIRSWIAT